MVNDDTFLLWSAVVKAGRPSFKGFEAEGEAVLPWWEAAAVVDHGLLTREHVPGLEILHLKVPIGRGTDVARTMVFFGVSL